MTIKMQASICCNYTLNWLCFLCNSHQFFFLWHLFGSLGRDSAAGSNNAMTDMLLTVGRISPVVRGLVATFTLSLFLPCLHICQQFSLTLHPHAEQSREAARPGLHLLVAFSLSCLCSELSATSMYFNTRSLIYMHVSQQLSITLAFLQFLLNVFAYGAESKHFQQGYHSPHRSWCSLLETGRQ